MKKITYCISICLLTGSFATAQTLSASLRKDLVAFYKFDKQAATLIKDYSGNNNHGMHNGVTYSLDRVGNDCSAAVFDGSTTYVSVPTSATLESPVHQLSVSVWVNLCANAHKYKQWLPICCKSDSKDETPESPQYRVHATVRTVSLNTALTKEFVNILKDNQWYHYVHTYDGTFLKVYVDKKLVFQTPYTNSLVVNKLPLEIGRDYPGAAEYFCGSMDDLLIYNRVLEDNDIQDLYDLSEKNKFEPCNTTSPKPPKVTATKPKIDTVLVSQPVKIAKKDTVFVSQTIKIPKNDTVFVSQTVKITKKDTVLIPQTVTIPQKDTVYIPETVTIYTKDTVYERKTRTVVQYDTVYQKVAITVPDKIDDTKVVYQSQAIKVKSRQIKVTLYDSGTEDGDIISLNFNGEWIKEVEKYTLKSKRNGAKVIILQLEPNKDNFIVSKAWNLGTISPNTLTIDIEDGRSPLKTIHLNSQIGVSDGIKIWCD